MKSRKTNVRFEISNFKFQIFNHLSCQSCPSLLIPLHAALRLSAVALLSTLLACAARPRGPLAYVTNERDGTITVIDTATDRVVSTFNVGGRLRGVRVGPDGRVYVAASTPSGKSYDPKENHVAAVAAAGGEGVATYEVGPDPGQFALSADRARP